MDYNTEECNTIDITPLQFERSVKEILEGSSKGLISFEARHRERLKGVDGSYEIDVTARFQALGADFLVLVECKHTRNPIKREIVQILRDRLQATGAQKGIIFSTSGYQKGAQEYACLHGIALIHLMEGRTCWVTRSSGPPSGLPPWQKIPDYIGWQVNLVEGNNIQHRLFSRDCSEYLDSFLENGRPR